MHIESLTLKNYRNYKEEIVSFKNNVNVILGENAQGKTNLIEAIYVLAMAKSHRTAKDKELISWDEAFAKISGNVVRKNGPLTVEIIISAKGKKAKLNSLEQRKLSEYIGAVNVVMFAPEDLTLVKGTPAIRRRFIDMEVGQITPIYLYYLGKYQKILQQRNFLLKELQHQKKNKMMLEILTTQLVEVGAKVIKKRMEFLQLLQRYAEQIHYEISRGKEQLVLQYKPSFDVSEGAELSKIEEGFFSAFTKLTEKEIYRGSTLIGPHRDDICFLVNDKEIQTYGSQGQQRTAALSVKLAEIDLIKEKIGDYPILLLDDVLSELDSFRQSHLLNAIQGKVQTFVTTTSVDSIDHQTLHSASTYIVKQGQISVGK